MYAALIQKLDDIPFEYLLDVGCGTGKVLSLIIDKFNAKVSGIDLSLTARRPPSSIGGGMNRRPQIQTTVLKTLVL